MTALPKSRGYLSHPFWQAVGIMVFSYVLLAFVVPVLPGSAIVPMSVLFQYMCTVLVGVLIGATLAARVAMTNMTQLVAVLHSFVGAAAVLVGIASYLDPNNALTGTEHVIHLVEVFVGVFIGAVTFTGSVVAYGKLQGTIGSKPLLLPGRQIPQPDRAIETAAGHDSPVRRDRHSGNAHGVAVQAAG